MIKRIIIVLITLASAAAAQTQVSVSDGSGAGIYRGKRFINVWADPAPPNMLFDRWSGDTLLVERSGEARARIKTGVKRLHISAIYRNAPEWSPGAIEPIGSSEMRYYFPPNPRGLIFHFHGTGGNLNGLFTQGEQILYARELVAAGFAIVTLNSDDRIARQWNMANPPNNPDVNNVQSAINLFISRGLITQQTPIFSSGVSNGGQFSNRVSSLLNFRGAAIYIAPGFALVFAVSNVPTIWNIAANDSTIGASNVDQARTNFQTLRSRGVRAEFNLLPATEVYRDRFKRISGLTAADSAAIYQTLKSNGFLDRSDLLIQNPLNSGWENVIPSQYQSFIPDISDQLQICYAEHKFFSDYNRRVVDFFTSL